MSATSIRTFYRLDSKNRVRVWTIQVVDYGSYSQIESTRGIEGMKMTPEAIKISEGKNIGKANETSPYSQATLEMQSKIDSKIREGYTEDKANIKSNATLGSGVKKPMLAHKYDATKKQSSSKDLKDLALEGKPIFVQRKKDGNRCNIIVDRNGATMWSRKGDEMIPLTHITKSIEESFNKIYKYVNKTYGVTSYTLDGELFTKAFSFNKLNGLVKKQTKTFEDIELCKKIKYHIYDVMIDIGYETRMKITKYFKSPTVHVEETEEIIASEKNIKAKLEKYLAEGEEGLMIRVPGIPYENKRSWSLMKVKVFEDSEFKVVGFEEDKRGGMIGAIICEMDQHSKDSSGNVISTFNSGLRFSHEECKEIWENQSKYIGKQVTVEFFHRSEYGVPRFPKTGKFRK